MYNVFGIGRVLKSTPRILPAAFDDAITYLEQIKIVNDKLNELITAFNEMGDDTLQAAMQYTDQQVAASESKITAQINALQESVNQQFKQLEQQIQQELDNAIEDFKEEAQRLLDEFQQAVETFNSRLSQLEISINTLWDAFARNKYELRQLINERYAEILQHVNDLVAAKTGNSIIVYNPAQQTTTTLNVALADLFLITREMFCLSAQEYADLQLTAQQYADLEITANEYVYSGRLIFFHQLYYADIDEQFNKLYEYVNAQVEGLKNEWLMWNPFSGQYVPVYQVVDILAQFHMWGLTAQEYAELDLTAQEYADKEITAYEYAVNGYYILKTEKIPDQILQEQVAQLNKLVADLSQRVDNIEQAVDPKLESRVDDLEIEVNTLKPEVASNTGKISTLEANVAINTADITSNYTEITDLKDDVSMNTADIVDIKDNIIPTEINNLNSTLSTVDAGLQKQISDNADTAATEIGKVNDKATANTEAINTVTAGLSKIHITYNEGSETG